MVRKLRVVSCTCCTKTDEVLEEIEKYQLKENNMGIDIIAFKNIKKVYCVFNIDGEPIDLNTKELIDNTITFYKNPDFPGRADKIENNCCYEYEERNHFF